MGQHKHSALKREAYRHDYRFRMRNARAAEERSRYRTLASTTTSYGLNRAERRRRKALARRK